MFRDRPPISTERPTCGNRFRSCRSPICSYPMPARSNTTNSRRKHFETNLTDNFSLDCILASTCSVIRMQEEDRLNEHQQDSEGYLPHSRAHYPLSRERNEPIVKKECSSTSRWCLVKYPYHLFGKPLAEPRWVQPNERSVKRTRHRASFGRAPRKRSFASRTMSSSRVISAEKTRRPNAVNR